MCDVLLKGWFVARLSGRTKVLAQDPPSECKKMTGNQVRLHVFRCQSTRGRTKCLQGEQQLDEGNCSRMEGPLVPLINYSPKFGQK